jgi:hypothetical protein
MPFCQVIKSNDKWCRNSARKGMDCCWVHRNLENQVIVPDSQDIFNELVESMNLVNENEIEWKLQERRVIIFKIIDTELPKELDWHYTMKMKEFIRNGFVCVNPL